MPPFRNVIYGIITHFRQVLQAGIIMPREVLPGSAAAVIIRNEIRKKIFRNLLTFRFTVMIVYVRKEEYGMTIKDFASLCGCNAKTLRYYDSIDLLKPARVDEWTGYRHYDGEQALMYVKIKNLQEAGFQISEIGELLPAGDDEVYAAIADKIHQQEQRLSRMKAIQQSYRTEAMKMQETVNTYRETIRRLSGTCDPMEEFGITEEAYAEIVDRTADFVKPALTAMQLLPDADDITPEQALSMEENEPENPVTNPANEIIAERRGWEHIKDALYDLPLPEGELILYTELKKTRPSNPAFTNVVMTLMADRCAGRAFNITCRTVEADADENCLWLLKRISG